MLVGKAVLLSVAVFKILIIIIINLLSLLLMDSEDIL